MTRRGVLRLVPWATSLTAAVCLAAQDPVAAVQTAPSPPPLELLVLGSGGPGAVGRAASCALISIAGTPRILVDAGPGSFARLGEAHVDLAALDIVLLTHLHVDHAAELPGIVKARAVASGKPIRFEIVGPAGRRATRDMPALPSTRRFVELLFGHAGAFAYLEDFAAPVSFKVVEVMRHPPEAPADLVHAQAGIRIHALAAHHGDAPAVVYRVDAAGRSVAFSGDIDARGLPALERLAAGVDLLVFDTVVLDPPGSAPILYQLHSPPRAIGELAARAHVGKLLLTHLSPAVDEHRSEVSASIAAHYSGPIVYASDGSTLAP